MELADTFELWQRLAGESESDPWNADSLYGFFQTFRPMGAAQAEALRQALLPIPQGAEVLERLKVAFAADDGHPPSRGYFDAFRPTPLSAAEAAGLVRAFLAKVTAMATASNCPELVELLRDVHVSTVVGKRPFPTVQHPTQALLHDVVCDWFLSLQRQPTWAYELNEAFFSVACDLYLGWHFMWPWFAASSAIDEPFAPWCELWLHGVEYRFVADSSLEVYLPEAG